MNILKRLLLALLLLPALAGAQQLVNCTASTACNMSSGPSNTGTGDALWVAFGKINHNFQTLPPTLLSGGALPVTSGGLGVGTLTGLAFGNGTSSVTGTVITGLVQGNGSSAPTAATAANVASTVGGFLQPITAAETTAGSTPVSLGWPVGHAFRYMTSAQIADVVGGTHSLDVSSAIQAALNVKGLVSIPCYSYRLSVAITVPIGAYPTSQGCDSARLIFDGGVLSPITWQEYDDSVTSSFVTPSTVRSVTYAFSNGFYGGAAIGGINAALNIYTGTNSSTDLGAIEATCFGFYTCGSNGWNRNGWTPGSLGGTGMGTPGGNPAGVENAAFGFYALSQCTTCSYNTGLGTSALGHETTGTFNAAVGEDSMRNTVGVSDNATVGANSLRNLSSGGDRNSALGFKALMGGADPPIPYTAGATIHDYVGLGYQAGMSATSGQGLVAIGSSAGQSITNGTSDVLIGWNAGLSITSGTDNVFLGAGAGQSATSATGLVLIGSGSGHSGSPGQRTTALGAFTLASASLTGGNNTALGYNSQNTCTTCDQNTSAGDRTLQAITTGLANVAIGDASGLVLTSGNGNVFVGPGTGKTVTTGGGNVIVGDAPSSPILTTGSNNTLLGPVDTYAAGTSNELNIRNTIRGGTGPLTSSNLSSCGTSPAISGTATDMSGTITTGSGATACTLTLAQVNGTAPTCLVTARSGTAPVYNTTDNGTTATLALTTAAASAKYDYWCPVH